MTSLDPGDAGSPLPPAAASSTAVRILDPRAIPVVGTDAHLPPLPHDRLTPDSLRRRFARGDPADDAWLPELPGDGGRLFNQHRVPAAASVLVPLVLREDGLHVLLTCRAEQLRDHAGQVSFPGGRAEPDDADVVATALREAEEEIGLTRDRVDVLGHLPVYTTVTSFIVTPVVALVHPPFELRLDPIEVAEAFEVPLAWLMTPAHHRHHVFEFDGGRRSFLSMPWTGGLDNREYFIWGATAAMLRNLYGYLAAGLRSV